MGRSYWLILPLALAVPETAHADVDLSAILEVIVDGGNEYNWEKVELPDTFCGNGSQYKFFVRRTSSRNLLFMFEGGGACWDYDTCSGRAGQLGAANPNGIPDDYMRQFQPRYASPILNGADPGLPFRSRTDLVTKDWNIVYMPYCTGDVHIGNGLETYPDPRGEQPPLTWNHSGYQNTISAVYWARENFRNLDKLLVTGFSAGGTATATAYMFVRWGVPAMHGYMVNDSGPIYPAESWHDKSLALHKKITESWDLDGLFDKLPSSFDRNDFGSINRVVAETFPNDQLAYTGYTLDYNYSRFSYERFLSPNDKNAVLNYWKEDQDKLVAELTPYPNVSFFIPHGRPINSSHCTTVITFIGSHGCERMEKKRDWWEYLEWPPGQSYKCYSEFVSMDTFLRRLVNENRPVRIYEPPNQYNDQDPGMNIVSAILNRALGG